MLDISVHSLSDWKHHFKYIRIGDDKSSEPTDTSKLDIAQDTNHGWINGEQIFVPPRESIERLFEDIEMASEFWSELPNVKAVTSLLLRRQTRRRWEQEGLETFIKLLPHLEKIEYEPWREWNNIDQRWTDEGNCALHIFETG